MQWNMSRMRPPTENDKKLVPRAIRMLSYIACLNYAACDLEEELQNAWKWHREIKHCVGQVQNVVAEVHQTAYSMLYGHSTMAGRQYNNAMDGSWREIDAGILLQAPERAYNIVCAICRLIEALNIQLGGKYDFAPAKKLYGIPALLDCCRLEDHHVDAIIDRLVS